MVRGLIVYDTWERPKKKYLIGCSKPRKLCERKDHRYGGVHDPREVQRGGVRVNGGRPKTGVERKRDVS